MEVGTLGVRPSLDVSVDDIIPCNAGVDRKNVPDNASEEPG